MKIEKLKQYCKFLRKYIDGKNYHEAFYDGFEKRWYPKLTKQNVLSGKFASINNGQLWQHAFNDRDYGYNTSCLVKNKQILICLDFDTDKNSKFRELELNNAIAKVEELLKIKFYVEDSTKSGDKHGYIIIDKGRSSAVFVNMVLRMLEEILDKECKKVGLKQFEIKGMPHEYTWHNDRIVDVKFSSPAKLPRDWESIDKLSTLTPVDLDELHLFASNYQDVSTEETSEFNQTSVGFTYYGFSNIMTAIQADILNKGIEKVKLNRRYIYSTHLATYLYLCWYFKKHNVKNPSIELFKYHWKQLKERDLVEFAWNKEIAIWCKKWLNENQFINWIDNRYCKSVYTQDKEIAVKGICCAWQITQELFSFLSRLSGGGNSGHTLFEVKRTGQTKRCLYDASIRFSSQQPLKMAG